MQHSKALVDAVARASTILYTLEPAPPSGDTTTLLVRALEPPAILALLGLGEARGARDDAVDRVALLVGAYATSSAVCFRAVNGKRLAVFRAAPGEECGGAAQAAEPLAALRLFSLPRLHAFEERLAAVFGRAKLDSHFWLAFAHLAFEDEKTAVLATLFLFKHAFAEEQRTGANAVRALLADERTRMRDAAYAAEVAREWAVVLANVSFGVPLTRRAGARSVLEAAQQRRVATAADARVAANAEAYRIYVREEAPRAAAAAPEPTRTWSDVRDDAGERDRDLELDADSVLPRAPPPPQQSTPEPRAQRIPGAPRAERPPRAQIRGANGRMLAFDDDEEAGEAGDDVDEATLAECRAEPSEAQMRALLASAELRAFAAQLPPGLDARLVAKLFLLVHYSPAVERDVRAHAPSQLHRHARRLAQARPDMSAPTRDAVLALYAGTRALPPACTSAIGEFVRMLERALPAERAALQNDGERLRRYVVYYSSPALEAWHAHFGVAAPSAERALLAFKRAHPTMSDQVRTLLFRLAPVSAPGAAVAF
jgi:hypothetical protein